MLEWEKKFETGNEKIDEQNRCLIDLGNRIWEMLHSDEENKLIKAKEEIKRLKLFCARLFVYEEVHMYDCGTNLSKEHLEAHRTFLYKVDELLEKPADITQEELFNLMVFVIDWINFHIVESDVTDFIDQNLR